MATAVVPMGDFTPSGSAYPVAVASSTRQMYAGLDPTTDGRWHFRGRVPNDYASAPSMIVAYIANATTGTARLNVEMTAVANAEDMDPTLTALTATTSTVPATAYLRKDVTWTTGVPTLAAGDIIVGAVHRDADASGGGTDSLTVALLVVGVFLSYTTA